MLAIIIARNRASDAALARTIEAAQSTGFKEITVFSESALPSIAVNIDEISIENAACSGSALSALMSRSAAGRFIIVDARLAPTNSELQSAIGAISRTKSAVMSYTPMRRSGYQIDISALKASNLLSFLSSSPEWPMLLVGLDRGLQGMIASLNSNSFTDLLASIAVISTVNDKVVSAAGSAISLGGDFATTSDNEHRSLALSEGGLSAILKNILENCAIEEMFADLPWENQEQSAGAAAYHSLAALFIRFGDLESATECLDRSENLEDNPRSLALRACIAERQGEMIGAVANLVASLQGYEDRIHSGASIEGISGSSTVDSIVTMDMKRGLDALNSSNNEEAYRYFSQAVMAFDPFFSASGIGFRRMATLR